MFRSLTFPFGFRAWEHVVTAGTRGEARARGERTTGVGVCHWSVPQERGSVPRERGSVPWERAMGVCHGSVPRERGSVARERSTFPEEPICRHTHHKPCLFYLKLAFPGGPIYLHGHHKRCCFV